MLNNKIVKEKYKHFITLVKGSKNVKKNEIILNETKKNRKDWLSENIIATHEDINDEINLIIETKKDNSKYGLKLRCVNFIKEPFFRFDSDGPAHRIFSEKRLLKQKIETPHFNSFDKKGVKIAYQSQVLKDEKQAIEIAKDLSFGVLHFFQESNINQGENINPIKVQIEDELFSSQIEIDPLNGINFDH